MALEFYRFIKTHAQAQPDHPAIIDGEATVTYAQLVDQVERFAGGLDSLSISPDGKLGLLCLNQKEYLIAFLGALLKGLPVVSLQLYADARGSDLYHPGRGGGSSGG
jgi:acyl-CoA synthetase (AMP-forming)/AMP-acid ligase II